MLQVIKYWRQEWPENEVTPVMCTGALHTKDTPTWRTSSHDSESGYCCSLCPCDDIDEAEIVQSQHYPENVVLGCHGKIIGDVTAKIN